jgi:hypothetical protein
MLKQTVPISKDGRRTWVTKYEAMFLLMVNVAMRGDVKLALRIVKMAPYSELRRVPDLGGPRREVTKEEARAAYERMLAGKKTTKGTKKDSGPVTDSTRKAGYRNPPLHTRFKKGESGNPGGRPRKRSAGRQILHEILREKVSIRKGDRLF